LQPYRLEASATPGNVAAHEEVWIAERTNWMVTLALIVVPGHS